MIVLDTNVVSELMRVTPDPDVLRWLDQHNAATLVTTAVTVAEVRYGIARLPHSERQRGLAMAANAVFSAFAHQILAFDGAAASEYAELVVAREGTGRPIAGFDAQIAAICRVARATIATRNVTDFADTGIDIINPWA